MTTTDFNQNLMCLEIKLKRFALKLTTSREDAMDLCQETLYKAMVYRHKFTHDNMQAWVFTIMRNIFINDYRKKIKNQTRLEDKDHILESYQEIGNEESNPLTTQYYQEIKGYITTLNKESRIPFLLHIRGFKYREISQILQIPLGTVKTRIFQGRQQLIKLLEAYHSERRYL